MPQITTGYKYHTHHLLLKFSGRLENGKRILDIIKILYFSYTIDTYLWRPSEIENCRFTVSPSFFLLHRSFEII